MMWRDFQRKQRVLELSDRFVSYVDEGSGPPLVLIHGMPAWGYAWSAILPALTAGARVLVPDLLGFGFSDKRDCFDRSIARQTAALEQWMEKLGISRATVVGHDIGGGVALRLATLHPSRVERLCLINAACYDSWPGNLMLSLGQPQADRRLSSPRTTTLLRRALKKSFASTPDEELVEGLLAPYATEVGKLSLIRAAAALNTNLTVEITHLLPQLTMPCLILCGEDDAQGLKYGERLRRDIPDAHLVCVQGARQFVMADRPEVVSGQLLQLVSGRTHVPVPTMSSAGGSQYSSAELSASPLVARQQS